MTTGAIIFMALSWTFVLGLTGWAFYRLLTHKKDDDPDGEEVPPELRHGTNM